MCPSLVVTSFPVTAVKVTRDPRRIFRGPVIGIVVVVGGDGQFDPLAGQGHKPAPPPRHHRGC